MICLVPVLMLRPFSPELVMFSYFEFRTSLGTSILLKLVCFVVLHVTDSPVGTPGVKLRIRPSYPQRVVKGD